MTMPTIEQELITFLENKINTTFADDTFLVWLKEFKDQREEHVLTVTKNGSTMVLYRGNNKAKWQEKLDTYQEKGHLRCL
jgi:hypothetical protein